MPALARLCVILRFTFGARVTPLESRNRCLGPSYVWTARSPQASRRKALNYAGSDRPLARFSWASHLLQPFSHPRAVTQEFSCLLFLPRPLPSAPLPPYRHATDLVERLDGAFQKSLLGLGRINPVDGLPGVGQPEDEHVALRLHFVPDHPDFTEIHPASAPGACSCGTNTSTRRPASTSICARRTRT
ncbi:MAG: hypothetical protein JWQ75_2178 [Pseudarthrobacter sp.]|nr:hypothetical protein [Pseudarthrobacter sp.]